MFRIMGALTAAAILFGYVILAKIISHKERMAEIELANVNSQLELAYTRFQISENEKSWFQRLFSGEKTTNRKNQH